MKAAILHSVNSPVEIEDLEIPQELSFGQVLVGVKVSGLCGAQLQEIRGEKNNEKFMPHLIGHEGCGIVEKIGPGVTRVKEGQKVIMHWRKAGGIESGFPSYFMGDRKISGGKVNTLCEKAVVSENRITPVPSDTDDEFCALMGCGLSTSFCVVNKDANVRFGETILVIGCGGVGLGCINSARMLLADRIFGIDISPDKKEMVEKNGGDFFLEIDCLRELAEKKVKLDCIIDTVGDLEIISRFLPFLSNSGRCVLVSLPKKGTNLRFLDPNGFFGLDGKSIISSQAGGFDPDADIPRFLSLLNSGKLEFKQIISHRFRLDEINEAISTLISGKSGRILIDII